MGEFSHLFVNILANVTIFIIVIYCIASFFLTIYYGSTLIEYAYLIIKEIRKRDDFWEYIKLWHLNNIKILLVSFSIFLPGFLIFILGISEILRGNIKLW